MDLNKIKILMKMSSRGFSSVGCGVTNWLHESIGSLVQVTASCSRPPRLRNLRLLWGREQNSRLKDSICEFYFALCHTAEFCVSFFGENLKDSHDD